MGTTKTKLVPVLITVGVSVICLAAFVFLLAGRTYFADVFGSAVWYVACISIIAGLFRLAIPGVGHLRSILCGFIIAGVGYLAVLMYAASRI